MRELKFEFLYRGMPFSSENLERPWFKKIYTLTQLVDKSVAEMSDVHSFSELVAMRQFTGIVGRNGIDIYCGDIVEYAHSNKSKGRVRSEVIFDQSGFTVAVNNSILNDDAVLMCCTVLGNIYQNPELLESKNG